MGFMFGHTIWSRNNNGIIDKDWRRQTYGYLPGRRASLPFGRYQIVLLGDRGTWVLTTCPELLPGGVLAGTQTRDLSISSPTR